MSPELFQQKILTWYDLNGRKDLPWQQGITPYKVWLSEIMLQQTQVSTVIPYFNEFIRQLPGINELASASVDSVLHLWSGLGYYARARNLYKTAQIIQENEGIFPDNLDSLIELPGIGRSTAGAILSIAFNKSHPILDGNVKRVLARFHAVPGWTGHTKVSNRLWDISTDYTPIKRCAAYTQAMMDLGATLCTRSKPKCDECPVNSACIARLEEKVTELPTPKPKKTRAIKQTIFLVLKNTQQQILLEKRPPAGIWGGLWVCPEYNSFEEIKAWCKKNNLLIQSVRKSDEQRHSFSHYHLDYVTFFIEVENLTYNVMETNHTVWYKTSQIRSLGLPAPIKKLLLN